MKPETCRGDTDGCPNTVIVLMAVSPWALYRPIGCQGMSEPALLAPYIFVTGSLIFALP